MNSTLFDKLLHHKRQLNSSLEMEEKYRAIFEEDFAEELRYLEANKVQNSGKNLNDSAFQPPSPFTYDMKKNRQVFKEIYKKLVKKIHPDLCQDEEEKKSCEEKMKQATEFMKSDNWEDLILLAQQENIDIPYIPIEYNKLMKKKIKHIEEQIEFVENKVAWVWCVDFKPYGHSKVQLYPSLNIVKEEYEEWKG
jgi:hypothetical protein